MTSKMGFAACVQYEPFESDDEGAWVDLTPQKKCFSPSFSSSPSITEQTQTSTSRSLMVGSLKDENEEEEEEEEEDCPIIITWKRNAIKTEIFYDSNDSIEGEEEETTTTKEDEKPPKEPTTLQEFVEELSKARDFNQRILSKLQAAEDETKRQKQEHILATEELNTELLAAKKRREDIEAKLTAKEQALERARREVGTLKKVIQQNTSMVTMQRDHAVASLSEKDRILQNYKDKINRLTDQLNECKRREQETAVSFERELQMLKESLASVDTPQSTASGADCGNEFGDDEIERENRSPRILSVLTNKQQTTPDNESVLNSSDVHVKEGSVKVKSLLSDSAVASHDP